MNSEQSLAVIGSALENIISNFPKPLDPSLYLMKDLGLESIDLLNLLVEIERALKARIDLIALMRQREGQAYQRDIRVEDLCHFLIQQQIK
jgi:acyl carrier protein